MPEFRSAAETSALSSVSAFGSGGHPGQLVIGRLVRRASMRLGHASAAVQDRHCLVQRGGIGGGETFELGAAGTNGGVVSLFGRRHARGFMRSARRNRAVRERLTWRSESRHARSRSPLSSGWTVHQARSDVARALLPVLVHLWLERDCEHGQECPCHIVCRQIRMVQQKRQRIQFARYPAIVRTRTSRAGTRRSIARHEPDAISPGISYCNTYCARSSSARRDHVGANSFSGMAE